MDADDRTERIMRGVERALEAMNEEGVAGGTIGPEGVRLGVPNWEERTKHQRYSERIKTHGYPLGFVKSQHATRAHLVESLRQRVEALGEEEREAADRAREAMAWALDAERTLGSFNRAGEDRFPLSTVDGVADHLLAWLDHQGFRLVPTDDPDQGAAPTAVEGGLPAASDDARKPAAPTVDRVEPITVNSEVPAAEDAEPADEDEEEAEGESCPLCRWLDGAPSEDCWLCDGTGRVAEDEVERELGPHRVTCLWCEDGYIEGAYMGATGMGCPVCLGTGRMPVAALDADALEEAATGELEFLCRGEAPEVFVRKEDLRGGDLSGLRLAGAEFEDCNLTGANFAGADLAGARFLGCAFTGANPEEAADLDGATLAVVGLTPEQRAACEAKGAVLAPNVDAAPEER